VLKHALSLFVPIISDAVYVEQINVWARAKLQRVAEG
jgi:hypothetical protein